MQKTVNGEKVGPVEIELIRKDKTKAIVEVSAFPVKRGGEVEVCGIARDISERKKMLEKLEEYSQQLEKLVEKKTAQLRETQQKLVKQERLAAIGQVSSMVGHDLRNPLTGIAGATYYLKKRLSSSLDEPSKEMFALIENNIRQSNEIVNDLLEYSKDVKLELKKTILKSLVQNALSTVILSANINVIDTTDEKQDITLDVQKMKRVFINIIENAVDAMSNGGTLKISSAQTDGYIRIAFSDTGSGIPRENLEKIWIPFFTTKAKGMGLGLPICKRIVEAHGGTITIESAASKGTTVTIALPIKPKTKEDGGEEAWVSKPEFL
jgi:signal transduction histidine kinase